VLTPGDEILQHRVGLRLVLGPVVKLSPRQVHPLLQLLQIDHDVLEGVVSGLLQISQLGIETFQFRVTGNQWKLEI
jgi:hypothetical protein